METRIVPQSDPPPPPGCCHNEETIETRTASSSTSTTPNSWTDGNLPIAEETDPEEEPFDWLTLSNDPETDESVEGSTD